MLLLAAGISPSFHLTQSLFLLFLLYFPIRKKTKQNPTKLVRTITTAKGYSEIAKSEI